MKSKAYMGPILALLFLGVAAILGLALATGTALSLRWTVYLFIVPFAMVVLTQIKSTFVLFLSLLAKGTHCTRYRRPDSNHQR